MRRIPDALSRVGLALQLFVQPSAGARDLAIPPSTHAVDSLASSGADISATGPTSKPPNGVSTSDDADSREQGRETRLIVVTNQLPVAIKRSEETGTPTFELVDSECSMALSSIRGANTTWIGWVGQVRAAARRARPADPSGGRVVLFVHTRPALPIDRWHHCVTTKCAAGRASGGR